MSAPLRVMIVDDEAPAREGLRIRLKREPGVVIIGEFAEAADALSAIRADPPDVLFLDIEMPVLDGFALLARTDDVPLPAVVFVTAHEEHAIHAFDISALDYLLKPVDQERLHESIARVREHLDRMTKGELADRMLGLMRDAGHEATRSASHTKPSVRIPVRKEGNIQFVTADEIDWIDAAGDSVRLHAGKSTHLIRKSMGEILAMLDPTQFLRIHRSTIVNVERVRELQPYFHGEYVVVLRDGTKLKLSRGHRDDLSRVLGLATESAQSPRRC